MVINTQIYKYY